MEDASRRYSKFGLQLKQVKLRRSLGRLLASRSTAFYNLHTSSDVGAARTL